MKTMNTLDLLKMITAKAGDPRYLSDTVTEPDTNGILYYSREDRRSDDDLAYTQRYEPGRG
jgi:hypothetical protein